MWGKVANQLSAAARNGLALVARIFIEGGQLVGIEFVADEAGDH